VIKIYISSFSCFNRNEWNSLFGTAVWRELDYRYLLSLAEINEEALKFMKYDDFVFPIYTQIEHKNYNTSEMIMNDFLQILLHEYDNIPYQNIVLVFVPKKINERSSLNSTVDIIETLRLDIKKIYGPTVKILLFYDIEDKIIFDICNIKKSSFIKCSYNSKMNINFNDFDEYVSKLNSKGRYIVRKNIDIFSNNRIINIGKINKEVYKNDLKSLYKKSCSKHEELYESDEFWDSIIAKSVEWYGAFIEKELIMFFGYWKNDTSAICSMFGKNYIYDELIKKTRAYFMLSYKLIDIAIKDNLKVMFNGYGLEHLKREMGYNIIDHYISLI